MANHNNQQGQLAKLEGDVARLKKELDSARRANDSLQARLNAKTDECEKLEKENGQLRSLAQKLREDAPPELGDGAYQLIKSATFTGANKGEMIDGKVGDVVVLVPEDGKPGATERDCKTIIAKLGAGYRAYPIDLKTLNILQEKDLIRG